MPLISQSFPATHHMMPGIETLEYTLQETPVLAEDVPPVLTPPEQVSTGYAFLRAVNGICDLRESMTTTSTLRLQALKQEMEEASNLLMQQLKESAAQVANSDFWSMLKKVANCLMSALSSICGLSLIGTGGSAVVGGALITSGVLSLSNLILTECKGWDYIIDQLAQESEEEREKLRSFIPAAVGMVAAGCGLVGSVYGITTGALDFTQKVGGIAQTALTLFNAGSSLGKGVADSKLLNTQADITFRQEDLKLKQEEGSRLTEDITVALEGFTTTFKQAKSAIRYLAQAQSKLIR